MLCVEAGILCGALLNQWHFQILSDPAYTLIIEVRRFIMLLFSNIVLIF